MELFWSDWCQWWWIKSVIDENKKSKRVEIYVSKDCWVNLIRLSTWDSNVRFTLLSATCVTTRSQSLSDMESLDRHCQWIFFVFLLLCSSGWRRHLAVFTVDFECELWHYFNATIIIIQCRVILPPSRRHTLSQPWQWVNASSCHITHFLSPRPPPRRQTMPHLMRHRQSRSRRRQTRCAKCTFGGGGDSWGRGRRRGRHSIISKHNCSKNSVLKRVIMLQWNGKCAPKCALSLFFLMDEQRRRIFISVEDKTRQLIRRRHVNGDTVRIVSNLGPRW